MKRTSMRNAFVSGTGFYVPPCVVTNQDLADRFGIGISPELIVKRTGIECRRFAEEGVGSSEIAEPAARMAIESAGLRPSDLEMILFATLSPQHAFPGSGVYLQQKLGIPGVPAMDIRNQCSGFVYGLTTARSMVRSGAYDHVLLVGAECQSAGLDLSAAGSAVSSLFGDGAGAVVVSATDEDRGIRTCRLGADGRHADALAQKIWDVRKRPFIALDADGNGVLPADDLWALYRKTPASSSDGNCP